MIKFNISELPQVAYLTNNLRSNSCLEIMDKEPINSGFIKAPKLVCYMLTITLINTLDITDFDFKHHQFSFSTTDFERVDELFELYASMFNSHTQYLVIQCEDHAGYPRTRIEFDVSLKQQIFNDFKEHRKNLDLLQVASAIIVDSLSIRKFAGHLEVINRLGALPEMSGY
ncbi:hypothetical protein R8N28_21175 [Vibrio sp. Vb1554]|uniref:hypothetical protein n=1 Tax=Vibrio sp. Vb1554 TaxID=3074642 RepID=UPI0029672780|nr:hypothetical protein [Vibrio sp. Vb1554]MDW3048247.1 hypothetical protein [Vibrio sp. Vb1554]